MVKVIADDKVIGETSIQMQWIMKRSWNSYNALGELECVMNSFSQHPPTAEPQKMMEEVDVDKKGVIYFSEFATIMKCMTHEPDEEKELAEVFNVLGMDCNWFISAIGLKMWRQNWVIIWQTKMLMKW